MLLADRLLASTAPEKMPNACALIRQAQKFLFAGSHVAETLAAVPEGDGWNEFCMLPYPETWIEFAGRDIQDPESARVGFLLWGECETPKGRGFCVAPYVLLAGDVGIAERFIIRFSDGAFQVATPDGRSSDDGHIGADAWAVRNALLSLNVRDFVVREPVDKGGHNTLRARHGKPPLYSHVICRINQSLLGRHAPGKVGKIGVRAHLVRGHSKLRKSGRFNWRPFARGTASLGIVTKDYLHA